MRTKEALRQAILEQLQHELNTATQAADAAKDTATSDETVAENKYDTFGLEASYLAHGQSQRAAEILQAMQTYRTLPFKSFDEDSPIRLSAAVTLCDEEENRKYFFLGPEAGGLKADWDNRMFLLITPQTPLAKQLIGKYVGDSLELSINNQDTNFDIIEVE